MLQVTLTLQYYGYL